MKITSLPDLARKLPSRERKLFKRIFQVEEVRGKLRVPEALKPWVEEKFGSVSLVEKQRVVKVTNKVTLEAAFFNQLRSRRPVEASGKALESLLEAGECLFCRPETFTAEDVFGRIRGKHGVTAANIAKYDCWHGLVVFTRHNPLGYRREEVLDCLSLAFKWFRQVRKADGKAVFPFLLWNCLWRSGASIVHGHLQIAVSRKVYPKIEYLRRCAARYQAKYRSNYFQDLFKVYRELGLTFKRGSVRVMASLTPVKEKEVILLADKADTRLFEAVYRVFKVYRRLGVSSFNLSLVPPPMASVRGWQGFPVIARMVDRGNLEERTSDMGGMELYAASIIASDPFQLAEELKKTFKAS
ncbi:MAG: hypothetical protein AYL30_000280 [Candidatus Hecatellales archaeon B24]|nr:MAG: hypothetical protein AYL30_000280 [Candidatus Hecatellales archaeon B24]